MKVSREKARQNRKRIVEVAAKLFRERGFESVGVDDLMKAAGLSHGGFYGNFKSKEQLILEACEVALMQNVTWLKAQVRESKNSRKRILDVYLSPAFRDMPGYACLMAALGSEISRRGHAVRRMSEKYTQEFIDVLAQVVPGATKADRYARAMTIYATLIGAVVLARAVDDPAFSKSILRTVRKSLAKP
jgi:TetR/AcrR family transcriptional repressor of nem operon